MPRRHHPKVAPDDPAGSLQVREHLTAIMGDGLGRWTPRAPTAPAPSPASAAPAAAPAPAGTPAVPQGTIIGDAFRGDLEERALKHLPVTELGNHRAACSSGFRVAEGGADVLADRLAGPDSCRGASCNGERDKRRRCYADRSCSHVAL